eukprot:1190403-Prorocentrum_minimum.AAC.3
MENLHAHAVHVLFYAGEHPSCSFHPPKMRIVEGSQFFYTFFMCFTCVGMRSLLREVFPPPPPFAEPRLLKAKADLLQGWWTERGPRQSGKPEDPKFGGTKDLRYKKV